MRLKIRRQDLVFILLKIVYVFSFIFGAVFRSENNCQIETLFPWIIVLLGLQCAEFYSKRLPIYDIGLCYIIISYAFMFGFVFMDKFNMKTMLVWSPRSFFTEKELYDACCFAILSLALISSGYLLGCNSKNYLLHKRIGQEPVDESMYTLGILLIGIGGIAHIINDGRVVMTLQAANSYSAFSETASVGLLDDLAYLLLPGYFFALYSGKMKKHSKVILTGGILAYLFVLMTLTGSRKTQLFSIMSVLLAFAVDNRSKKNKLIKTIAIAAMGYVLITALIVIRESRFNLKDVVPTLIESVTSFNMIKILGAEIFAETGITLLSVAQIMKNVPSIFPYEWGATFVRAIPSIFPIGWLVGDFFNKGSSTFVINQYTGIPVGSSLIGDLYWNWGMIGGIVVSFLIGLLFAMATRVLLKKNLRANYALYFSLFSQMIMLVRAEMIDIIRPIAIFLAIALVVYKFKFRIKI